MIIYGSYKKIFPSSMALSISFPAFSAGPSFSSLHEVENKEMVDARMMVIYFRFIIFWCVNFFIKLSGDFCSIFYLIFQ